MLAVHPCQPFQIVGIALAHRPEVGERAWRAASIDRRQRSAHREIGQTSPTAEGERAVALKTGRSTPSIRRSLVTTPAPFRREVRPRLERGKDTGKATADRSSIGVYRLKLSDQAASRGHKQDTRKHQRERHRANEFEHTHASWLPASGQQTSICPENEQPNVPLKHVRGGPRHAEIVRQVVCRRRMHVSQAQIQHEGVSVTRIAAPSNRHTAPEPNPQGSAFHNLGCVLIVRTTRAQIVDADHAVCVRPNAATMTLEPRQHISGQRRIGNRTIDDDGRIHIGHGSGRGHREYC